MAEATSTTESDLVEEQHSQTTRLAPAELVRRLNDDLGATLVAGLAGVRDRKLPYKWATAGGPVPNDEALRRLLVAHRAWVLVSDADNDYVARAWFIGANPRLDEESPVARLRAGDLVQVMAAARAFAAGQDD